MLLRRLHVPMPTVRTGDRFVTTRALPGVGLTHWRAPHTRSLATTIPEAIVLVARTDATADAFFCVPERYHELEAAFVPEHDRTAADYTGYSFVFPLSDVDDGTLRRL
jgi:hypothetical protein